MLDKRSQLELGLDFTQPAQLDADDSVQRRYIPSEEDLLEWQREADMLSRALANRQALMKIIAENLE